LFFIYFLQIRQVGAAAIFLFRDRTAWIQAFATAPLKLRPF